MPEGNLPKEIPVGTEMVLPGNLTLRAGKRIDWDAHKPAGQSCAGGGAFYPAQLPLRLGNLAAA